MYYGKIKTEQLDNGVTMELLEDIHFIDKGGIKWTCRKGDWVDGASVPRFFWRFIGPPLRGKYRAASVFHDVACTRKTGNTESASLMFYDAMIESGTHHWRAKLMYWSVYYFGPQW